MRVTWLGQNGLILRDGKRTVIVDPYLSDAVERANPAMERLLPLPAGLSLPAPDVLALTHDHLDHTDPDTLKALSDTEKEISVLASRNAWNTARSLGFSRHNSILFDEGTEVSLAGICFRAIRAVHSDPCAVGVLVRWEAHTLYITGDTLYHSDIIRALPADIDLLFVCINGYGCNMNAEDAARFTNAVVPRCVVPVHWGLYRQAGADPHGFAGRVDREIRCYIIEPYREYRWEEIVGAQQEGTPHV